MFWFSKSNAVDSVAAIMSINGILLISHRGEPRTPKSTKMEIFVENFPLTVVTKNFVLDATVVLDPRDRH